MEPIIFSVGVPNKYIQPNFKLGNHDWAHSSFVSPSKTRTSLKIRRASRQMPTSSGQRRQGAIICVLIAALGLPYGAYGLWNYWNFASKAKEAAGQIVARNSSTFTIQYTVNEQTYQIDEDLPNTKGMSGQNRIALQPGKAVMVLYDPMSPQSARWQSDRLWLFPVAIIFVSALAGLGALFPEFMSQRRWGPA